MDSGKWKMENDGLPSTGYLPSTSSPAAHCSLLPAYSPALAALRAKQAARAREEAEAKLHRRLPLERFNPSPFGRTRPERRRNFALREEIGRQKEEIEMEGIMGMINYHTGMPDSYLRKIPAYLHRDDHDGYLLPRAELDSDSHEPRRPAPRRRRTPWGRPIKRALTARERLAKVKPSVRIVPTGPRSSELVVTRRLHELSFGLKEALNLARFIEGAIKYRNPAKPNRKQSWRQKLRSAMLYRPGLLTWLTRNPISHWDSSRWTDRHRRHQTLALGPVSFDALRQARSSRRPQLTELFPEAALPKPYLELVHPGWLTSEGSLFAATPGGDFATSVEGFPLRLPVAMMPPEFYERWLARGKSRSRKRRRSRGSLRRRKKAGCTCYLMRKNRPAFPKARIIPSGFS
jgi:hypothetical protein